MEIISHTLVNYDNSKLIQTLYRFRTGCNRDFLIGLLKSFLIKKGTVITGTGEDISVHHYCKILIKSVNYRLDKRIAKGLSKKIINKLLIKSIKESIGDINK